MATNKYQRKEILLTKREIKHVEFTMKENKLSFSEIIRRLINNHYGN